MNIKLRTKVYEQIKDIQELTEDCASSKKDLKQCLVVLEDALQKLNKI